MYITQFALLVDITEERLQLLRKKQSKLQDNKRIAFKYDAFFFASTLFTLTVYA